MQQKRERKTEYLDLDKTGDEGYQDELLARLTKVLRKKKRIVIIAGAGISVSAGSRSKRFTEMCPSGPCSPCLLTRRCSS